MIDRYLEALEQYEMEIISVRKGRGAWICETDQGLKLLREYRGTVRRLEIEDQILGMIDTRTSLRTDRYERNREGGLLTMAGDGTRYILKEWFSDRECNIRDSYEVRQSIARLAMLHAQLARIPFQEEWRMGSVCREQAGPEMNRHIREMQKARSFIRRKRGKTEFELCVIGNYDGFYEQAKEAFEHGVHHVTHLYNAMAGLSHRKPGVVGAAADDEHVEAEMICDGVHIHPATVRQTFKMFGDDRIIMISDSMEATGMPDGDYALGGQKVIKKGHLATLEDGTIAGSATNLMDCVRVVVQKMNIPLESAVKCAAVNSAKSVGIYDRYGSITPGKTANMVLLKEKDLSTKQVILKGKML